MKNSFEFTAQSIICNGKQFPATYSVTPSGAVTVFADVGDGLPAVRVQFRPGHEAHAAALAAAQAAEAAPVETEVPAPVEAAPAEAAEAPQAPEAPQATDPAPVEADPVGRDAIIRPQTHEAPQAVDPAPVEAEAAEAPQTADPAPVEAATAEAPQATEATEATAAPADKPWIGSTIFGKGWRIIFDAAAERTRVIIDGTPSDAMRAALEEARFFWSPKMQSWNKKLSCKARRAALELAEKLEKIA